MPTYEYRCPEGHQFEHFFRTISSALSTLACPTCGAVGERRMSGGSALVFKGSGFYITDYGKDGKKDQRQAPPTAEGSKGGEGSGASESGGERKAGSDKSASDKGESGKGSKPSSSKDE